MKRTVFFILLFSWNLAITQTIEKSTNEDSLTKNNSSFKKTDSLNKNYEVIRSKKPNDTIFYNSNLELYNKAILDYPNNEVVYISRGNFYLDQREFDKAISDFSLGIKLTNNDTLKLEALTNRASAKIQQRNFEGGYIDLLEAYKLDSTDVGVLSNLGAISDNIGKNEETIFYLEKTLEIDPNFYPAYGNLGFKYQELGEHKKAITYFNKVLEINPNEPLGYSNRSYNKLKIGDLKGALEDIEESIKLYPQNSYAYKVRALIYIELEDFEKACKDLDQSLSEGYTSMYGKEVEKLKSKNCSE